MSEYSTLADDFYVNLHLNTEMDLPQSRETVLHLFEQMQKHHPTMRNFYNRDKGEFVLEEDKDRGSYRWVSVESKRLCAGYVNPPEIADATKLHQLVMELAPFTLSVSPLDCESLNVMYGFDYIYKGNQNQLIFDALGISPALTALASAPGASILAADPAIQLALDEDCRTQARVSIETRTSAFHVKTKEYPEENLSVYFTLRRYGSLDQGDTFVKAISRMGEQCRDLVDSYIVEQVLKPLQQQIAIR
jgi:hypothetical protein